MRNVSRILPLLPGIAMLSGCNNAAQKSNGQNDQKPNIIYIFADDLGIGDLSCYGATKVSTPNIDRLAGQGVQFTNAYATSATSTPSRFGLLTGMYPWRQKNTGIAPGNSELIIDTACVTMADMLKDAGIPMFGFDTQVGDMSYLTSYAGSDNYNAGYVCGEDLAKKVPDGGDILVLDSPTMQSVTDRTNGFLDAIKESGVTFNVVGQQDAQGNQQVANEKATDLLTAHPDVVAIFGGNDPTALGAYAAADAAGVTPLIYGVDGSPDVKALLKDTILEGTGAQSRWG